MPCYLCGQPATSVEHAPAKAFFPSGHRNNLITVESCTEHNENTSRDDEYVRNIIAMTLGNNGHALTHFLTTCIRSLKRSPGLTKITTEVNKEVYVREHGKTGLQKSMMLQIDRRRIDLVLRKIAYALFFHKYGIPWERELIIGTEYLVSDDLQQDEIGELLQESKLIDHLLNYEGSNPEIFKFVFMPTDGDEKHDQILRMKFYEGFEAWAIPMTGTTTSKLY